MPCRCQRLTNRLALFDQARVPRKFADKTLEAFAPNHSTQEGVRRELIELSRTFRSGDQGLVLMGPVGTGKTHLVVGLLRELSLERGVKCRFQDFHGMLAGVRDLYSQGRAESNVLGPLASVDVLVLDELGKGRRSRWEAGLTDELLSDRYNAGRTTIITTNYTTDPKTTIVETYRARGGSKDGEEMVCQETIAERLGDRVYSRLLEMCNFRHVLGPDYRQTESGECPA